MKLQELIDMVGVEEAEEIVRDEIAHGPPQEINESPVDYAHRCADHALTSLEDKFGPDYKLTLIARCTRTGLEDADMLVTRDNTVDILAAVQKRIKAEGPR